MAEHPLTDEMIDELSQFNSDLTGEQLLNRDYDMRAAADWQLEQVIEQWEELFNSTNMTDTQVIREFYTRLIEMRPQEDQ